MNNVPNQRVSPIHAPESYALPGRPDAAASAQVLDAYRQTQFLLGTDLALFEEAMNLQLRLVREAYPSKYRTHDLAAVMVLWSRSYTYLADSVLLACRGSYVSTLPLLRTAAECISAEEGLLGGEMEEHTKWLLNTLQPNEQHKAFEFELGRYFAGSVTATDPALRSVYRPAADLGRPNFGASLLQVAPESNNLRLAISFADFSFHLGWAEITLGWALLLAVRQVEVIAGAATVFPMSDEARAAFQQLQTKARQALDRGDRARIEEIAEGNDRRYLVHNFRRSSGAAPKKVLL